MRPENIKCTNPLRRTPSAVLAVMRYTRTDTRDFARAEIRCTPDDKSVNTYLYLKFPIQEWSEGQNDVRLHKTDSYKDMARR